MLEKKVYICELCGLEFDARQECYDHENSHIKPDRYERPVTIYNAGFSKYPDEIRFLMEDETTVTYRQSAIEPPEQKEASPEEGE